MPACFHTVLGGAMAPMGLDTPQPSDPTQYQNCEYVLLYGKDYEEIAVNNQTLPVVLGIAVVVCFVLGWIAGQQR